MLNVQFPRKNQDKLQNTSAPTGLSGRLYQKAENIIAEITVRKLAILARRLLKEVPN